MGATKVLLVFAVLTVLYGYSLYYPVPDDIEDKFSVRVNIALLKVMQQVCNIVHKLGFATLPELDRMTIGFLVKALTADTNRFQVEEEKAKIAGVPVRIYRPVNGWKEDGYTMVFFHSGGWTFGVGDEHDYLLREVADRLKIQIISTIYRLAPENPFPAATDDSFEVTKAVLQNKAGVKVNPKKVILMGDSAGGNMVAVTAIRLRDAKIKPEIKLQVILHAAVQIVTFDLPSYDQMEDFHFVTYREKVAFYALSYCGGNFSLTNELSTKRTLVPSEIRKKYAKYLSIDLLPKELRQRKSRPSPGEPIEVPKEIIDCMTHPYASPLLLDDLSGLPEALVMVAGHDGLRDDGLMYAKRLEQNKNKVTTKLIPSGLHDDFVFPPPYRSKSGVEALEYIINFLKKKIDS